MLLDAIPDGAVIFDCRHKTGRPEHGREAFAAGHIPGAVMIDCKAANFTEELKKLDPSKTYVMH